MEKIKVHIMASNHPVYNEIIAQPPENVEYQVKTTSEVGAKQPKFKKFVNQSIIKAFSVLNVPRYVYVKTDADLIHSSRGLLPLNDKPWVLDAEYSLPFFMRHENSSSEWCKNKIRKMLLSKNCKKIIPFSHIGIKSIISTFNLEGHEDKFKVIYPAVKPSGLARSNDTNKIKFLFVGRRFFGKGGRETLEAFRIIKKKYPKAELTMWCDDVPQEYIQDYKEVNFISEFLPRDYLIKELYCKSDIFIMPTYIDTFGMVFLEAMSLGLPIISTDVFAVPEIVEDRKSGLIVKSNVSLWDKNGNNSFIGKEKEFDEILKASKPEIVKQLVDCASELIENPKLRESLGAYGKKMIEKGKFSIKQRNKDLYNVYKEALL